MKLKEVKKCMKKGTKVEIIDNSIGSVNKIGDIGVITEFNERRCRVFCKDNAISYTANWHYFTDIKPLKETYTKEQCERKVSKWQSRLAEFNKPTTYEQIKPLVIEWAKEKNLIDSCTQYLEVYEKIEELAKAMLKDDLEEVKGAIGHVAIALIIYSKQTGIVCDKGVNIVSREFNKKYAFNLFIKAFSKFENRNTSLSWLNELAHSYNTNIDECLTIAWNTIKDRKGKTINETIIKE